MYRSNLEKLGVHVSHLGFGAMRFPFNEDGTIDMKKSEELIDYAYANGVNYFDTAYNYLNRQSQPALSAMLKKYPRDSYFYATKMPTWLCHSMVEAERLFHEQLADCSLEYFDFYLIHALDEGRWPRMKEIGLVELLEQFRQEGKLRFLGFSYHGNIEAFREILDAHDWDFVQIQINYLDEALMNAKIFHEELTKRNIPCIVMEPVKGGALSALPEKAQSILDSFGEPYSPSQWAFRWCLSQENMPLVLSGMSTLAQVKENIDVFSHAKPLSKSELASLHEVRDILLHTKSVPCTACNYCEDCPSEVRISEIFDLYNQYRIFNTAFRSKAGYAKLGNAHNANACTECGLCEQLCPQKIEIRKQLKTVHEEIKNIAMPLTADLPAIE